MSTSPIHRVVKVDTADSVVRLLSPPSSTSKRVMPLARLRVVMDVDECMLYAYEISQQELSRRKLSPKKGIIVWTEGSNSYPLKVYLRPGLKNFLHEVSQFADLYVMTAGNASYARPLIRVIDPEGKIFKDIITREKFDFRVGKNLEALGEKYDKKRTVLVDNMAMNFSYQRSNGILVREFLGDSYDDQLEYVRGLIQNLQNVEDVRDVLEPVCENGEYLHAYADEYMVWE